MRPDMVGGVNMSKCSAMITVDDIRIGLIRCPGTAIAKVKYKSDQMGSVEAFWCEVHLEIADPPKELIQRIHKNND